MFGHNSADSASHAAPPGYEAYAYQNAATYTTESMMPPDMIDRQRQAYTKMINDQLSLGVNVLDKQMQLTLDVINIHAKQQVNEFSQRLDEEVGQQRASWSQQHAEQRLSIFLQAAERRQELEEQAMQHAFNYRSLKLEESIMNQQYQMEKRHSTTVQNLEGEFSRSSR